MIIHAVFFVTLSLGTVSQRGVIALDFFVDLILHSWGYLLSQYINRAKAVSMTIDIWEAY